MRKGNTWKISTLTITGDSRKSDSPYQFSDEIEDLIRLTYQRINNKRINNPGKLLELIEKYPQVPAFKNYLVIFYIQKGKNAKARETNRWLLKEHPGYLFGKLNLCAEYLEDNRLEEIPNMLGEYLDLGELYPDRKIFHAGELKSFFNIAIRYLIISEEIERAESYTDMVALALSEDDDSIKMARGMLEEKKTEQIMEKYADLFEKREQAEGEMEEPQLPTQVTVPPVFHHDEIWDLYKYNSKIDTKIFKTILQLPRETVLEDLEKVLLDAIERFHYFEEQIEKGGRENNSMAFSLHAMALLVELGAKEKVKLILEQANYGDDFEEFYYGDHLTETFWQFIFHLCLDDLESLKVFFSDRELTDWPRIIIIQAVGQLGLHYPERKLEVVQWFEDILDLMKANIEDPIICSYEVLANVIVELCDYPAKVLLPKIKFFYDIEFVDIFFCGDYHEVELEIKRRGRPEDSKLNLYKDIFSLYQDIVANWYFAEDEIQLEKQELENELEEGKKEVELLEAELKALKKERGAQTQQFKNVGRNDPCPCGSNKKYKKCCMVL